MRFYNELANEVYYDAQITPEVTTEINPKFLVKILRRETQGWLKPNEGGMRERQAVQLYSFYNVILKSNK